MPEDTVCVHAPSCTIKKRCGDIEYVEMILSAYAGKGQQGTIKKMRWSAAAFYVRLWCVNVHRRVLQTRCISMLAN